MPIFLDRHDLPEIDEETAAQVAELHAKDLEVQKKHGVNFLTYWFDPARGSVFCLVEAPDKETADKVHDEAHGEVSNEMIEVDLSAVEAFLGRIQDPPAADSNPISETAYRAVMFTDMVASTEITAKLGDAMSVELVRVHDAIVRRSLSKHGGRQVKHLGDGAMASFEIIPDSVRCAVEIERELAAYNEHSSNKISVRIGIHAGEPFEDGGDLFGTAVQLAARICSVGDTGGTHVSGEVVTECSDSELEFISIGKKELKGFPDEIELFVPAI
jgi:class 3 adenylate cyclase